MLPLNNLLHAKGSRFDFEDQFVFIFSTYFFKKIQCIFFMFTHHCTSLSNYNPQTCTKYTHKKVLTQLSSYFYIPITYDLTS